MYRFKVSFKATIDIASSKPTQKQQFLIEIAVLLYFRPSIFESSNTNENDY